MPDMNPEIAALAADLDRMRVADPDPVDTGEGRVFVVEGDPPTWTEAASYRSRSPDGAPYDPWSDETTRVEKGVTYQGEDGDVLGRLGHRAIRTPLYDPAYLWDLYRRSAHLKPVVAAYTTGIETPYTIDPVMEFGDQDDSDLHALVRGALAYERSVDALDADPLADLQAVPTDAEVVATIERLRDRAGVEGFRLQHILSSFAPGSNLLELRRRSRTDMEVTGSSFWEVRRVGGSPRYAYFMPSTSVREVSPDPSPAEWVVFERRTPFTLARVAMRRVFRRFVQRSGTTSVWFKEYGDPRFMDARTGAYHDRPPADAVPATEVYQRCIDDPLSSTGCPRWSGTITGILGAIAAERVNLDYFRAKPPAGLLMVNGTRLSSKMMRRIESTWQNRARGEERFHGLVVIEAVNPQGLPSQASGKVSVEFVPLTDTQQGDALFQHYDRAVAEKIGAAFRLPGIARGRVDDANRANAEAGREATESVYAEERDAFDESMNADFIPAMGISLWRIRSLAPDPKDYEAAKIVVSAADGKKRQIMTLNESRSAFADALNITLPPLSTEDQESLPESDQ